jgi:PAS domain S-box-containing protein
MSFILISSIIIRLAAFGWSIRLLRQLKDWRMAFLSGMLALMALRQILAIISERESWAIVFLWHVEELPGLAVSVLALLAVLYLKNMITEHDQAVAERHKSESRLANIVDIAADAIITTDKDQHILHFNQGAEQIFGYQAEEVLGQPFDLLLPSRFVKVHQQHIRTFATAPKSTRRMGELSQDIFGRRKDGSEFPADASISRLSMDNQITFTVILRDVTDRVRLEEALKKSEKHLRNVLDGLGPHMLVGLMTPEGALIEANRPALEIAGLKPEDVLGKPFEQTYWWSYSESIKKQLHDAIHRVARGETCRYDVVIRVGENRFITIDFCLQPFLDEAGNITYLIPSAVDITERKRAEEALHKAHEELEAKVIERTNELAQANIRLQELDQLKSMFIASMSHELRTPLNSIIGFSGVILQGMSGEVTEEQRKQLTIVKRSANHLLGLINDIIDVSKIEADKVELAIERFDLPSLVREVKESFTLAAQEHDLALALATPDSLTIESDKRRVKQILVNFMSNAVKFTDQGKIEIKVVKRGDVVEISVMDTGIGIREEDMGHLLKAFNRIRTEGRISEGSGLGLYLSRKIAILLGGGISAESEFGKGSTFTFILPLRRMST